MKNERWKVILFWAIYFLIIGIEVVATVLTDFFDSNYFIAIFASIAITSLLAVFSNIFIKIFFKENSNCVIKEWKKVLLIGCVSIIVITNALVFMAIFKPSAALVPLLAIASLYFLIGLICGGGALLIFLTALLLFRLAAKNIYVVVGIFVTSMLVCLASVLGNVLIS